MEREGEERVCLRKSLKREREEEKEVGEENVDESQFK